MTATPFTKMHGIGNDYLYVNTFAHTVPEPIAPLARAMSDRHFGIGADGLILIGPPTRGTDAHVRMRMFNADGSESEMCGNGIRCVCKYAHDRGLSNANPMRIETGRGVLTLEHTLDAQGRVDQVTVDMGEPIWDNHQVPVNECELGSLLLDLGADADRLLDPEWNWLSMGNPHIVFFTSNVAEVPLERWGPIVERHRAFPKRVNAHFVQIQSPTELTMRTWERGTGITLGCGTGAAAVCAASVASQRADREVLAHLPGGDLTLRWDETTNHVFMTGPATEVFSGEWPARPA